MAANVDDILPKASDVMKQIAEAQAEKAAAHDRQKAAERGEKDALIKKISQASGMSEEEKVKLASRADSVRARLASCAVAALYADARRRQISLPAA